MLKSEQLLQSKASDTECVTLSLTKRQAEFLYFLASKRHAYYGDIFYVSRPTAADSNEAVARRTIMALEEVIK